MKMRSGMKVTAMSLAACAGAAQAQSFSEGFDGASVPAGWTVKNQSEPLGTTQWNTGQAGVPFLPRTGAAYVWANYQNGSGLATLSDWLISPNATTITNNDTFTFWTRTVTGQFFPDRLQLRM